MYEIPKKYITSAWNVCEFNNSNSRKSWIDYEINKRILRVNVTLEMKVILYLIINTLKKRINVWDIL